jgi:small subunit ribosomal protein S2
MEKEEADGRLALRTKKEQILILKEKANLERTLGGIKQMRRLPAALFVVDPKTDEIAVKEARKLKIPVIAICDTNVDPDMVDICIPANDDIAESVNLIINNIVDNYAEAINLVMIPSALKTVAPKKTPFEERQGGENFRNANPSEAKSNPVKEETVVADKPSE